MKLKKQTEYALKMLVHCAENAPRLSKVGEIAATHGISRPFAFKLIKPLVDSGILETVQGPKGGIRLGKPAGDISVLDVIRLTEDEFAISSCPFENGTECRHLPDCILRHSMKTAADAFFTVLSQCSLAHLIGSSSPPPSDRRAHLNLWDVTAIPARDARPLAPLRLVQG